MFKGFSREILSPLYDKVPAIHLPRQAPRLGILISPSAWPQGTPPLAPSAPSKYHCYDQRSLKALNKCVTLVVMVAGVGGWGSGGGVLGIWWLQSPLPFPHSSRTGRQGGGGEDREDLTPTSSQGLTAHFGSCLHSHYSPSD